MRIVVGWVLAALAACEIPSKEPPADGASQADTAGSSESTDPDAGDEIAEDTGGDTSSSEEVVDATRAETIAEDTTTDLTTDLEHGEVAPPDPCDPNPCIDLTSPHCDVYRTALVSHPSTCTGVEGVPVCEQAEVSTACQTGELCLDRACTPVATRCEFPITGQLAVTTWIDFGDQALFPDPATGEREDACCRDWDGDGFIDNALGDTFRELATILGPSGAIWEGVVARGPPVLELRGVDDWTDDPEVELIGYAGSRPLPDEGTVVIGADGFEPGTNLPPVSGWGRIEGGVLHVEDGYLRTVVGPPDAPVVMEYRQLHVEARVTPDTERGGFSADGVAGARGARVSGLIQRDAIFTGLNQHGFDFCRCVSFDDVDEPFIDLATGQCHPPESRAPTPGCTESDSLCELLEGPFCDFLVARFQPDIDTNGDGRLDAISVGQWTTLIATRMREVEDCP